jgi:hypothetical protein
MMLCDQGDMQQLYQCVRVQEAKLELCLGVALVRYASAPFHAFSDVPLFVWVRDA